VGDVSLAVLARELAALVAPTDTLTAALGDRTTGLVPRRRRRQLARRRSALSTLGVVN
jgi:hypothetical protein